MSYISPLTLVKEHPSYLSEAELYTLETFLEDKLARTQECIAERIATREAAEAVQAVEDAQVNAEWMQASIAADDANLLSQFPSIRHSDLTL
jgi:hypothetical protein